MYHLTLFFSLLVSVSAKIVNYNDFDDDNGVSSDTDNSFDNNQRVGLVNRRPLWVLNLKDDWSSPQLRLGTDEENIEFDYYASPLIKNPSSRRMKKDDPINPTQMAQTSEEQLLRERNENINLRNEILKIINKFALSTTEEPDSYLSESDENSEPSIELHFKGDYTSLVVNCDNKMWRYFINPPSTFPAWFYTIHDTDSAPIPMPDTMTNEFYKSLLRILKKVFDFSPLKV